MGVYIKGIEMPKDCGHCLLCEQDTIYDALVYRCLVTDNYLDDGYEHQIMKDCPLVPVPPHGRLIDADELAEKHRELAYELRGANYDFHMTAKAWLDNAPTIIPSEEGNW